ncbi:MAG: DUF1329 domain-containing protein [Pseudomonas sp.]|uniref:DUF1329 domain-containing protein n=1 Tax=Pseudomonas sp. TaxID=306 RepID=UPI003D6F270B
MQYKNTKMLGSMFLAGFWCVAIHAAPGAELGPGLLPWGATKAGNEAKTIPEYDGRDYAKGEPIKSGIRPDPFADEKPLFTITAKNMAEHADQLSDGIKAMLQKYPDRYRLDIYPTHRTKVYPQWVQDNSIKNATACKLADGNLKLQGCFAGVPFPVPKDGAQVMWNHLVRYSTSGPMEGRFESYVVDASGRVTLQGDGVAAYYSPFFDQKWDGPVPEGTDYFSFRSDYTAPARQSGEKILTLDSTDMSGIGDRVWQYLPGQRRVKSSPDLTFDTPSPVSGGSQTMEDVRLHMGSISRFDYKLVGKKELYIPYNSFKMLNSTTCGVPTLMQPNFHNPDCTRWELHRVWVVEATRKPGVRHLYSKKMFYFDEDAPDAGVSDSYDGAGKAYRVNVVFPYTMFEEKGFSTDMMTTYDLQTGIYGSGYSSHGGWFSAPKRPLNYFTADGLSASGVR